MSTAAAGSFTIQAWSRTVWDGVYTAAQADRGSAVYVEQCSRCHGDFLDGEGAAERAAALTGTAFEEEWESASLNDLFVKIARTMPRASPGTLSGRQALDVMAFLLRSSGYPAGSSELSDTPDLATIDIVGRAGPRPLRAGAGVRTVGCLVREADGAWTLARASAPVRIRTPQASTGRDLDRARSTPAGSEVIRLAGSAPHGDASVGTRVEVKGVLSTLGPPQHGITVMSLQVVGSACP